MNMLIICMNLQKRDVGLEALFLLDMNPNPSKESLSIENQENYINNSSFACAQL